MVDEATLKVAGVTKAFGGVTALCDIDLEVSQSEIVGIIGPNGSGKTTLLNVISGVYSPSRGEVRLGGRRISSRRPDQVAARGIARTFQNIRLFADLTPIENVAVAAGKSHRAGAAQKLARRLIDEFGLTRWADAPATSLPYGSQRRLEIARALALEPRILLLDEPAAGLNDAESIELAETIHRLRDQHHCGLLVIDHDMHMMMNVCDRVVVLNEGHKIADAAPEVVRHDPAVIEAYLG